jgi:adenine deaminase
MPFQRSSELKERIDVARGKKEADLVLRGGRLINVFSGEVYKADVAVYMGRIAGVGEYRGKRVVDVSPGYLLPGLIDSHVHIESSQLTPSEFARAAVIHGTTTVISDPHEIANVLGLRGIRYFLRASADLPVDFFFLLPSCVPATPLETSGTRLSASDLVPLMNHKRVIGLAEMMNYHGVLSGDREALRKIGAFQGRMIDGHAPGLSGRDLNAYIGAGIQSDHECVSADEAREKVRLGMTVFIREGSSAKDLERIIPAITQANSSCFCLATDDLQARDLQNGGINLLMKKAIRLGLDPMTAIRIATINPARHFCLKNRGAILPGYIADILVIDDLKRFTIRMVFKGGTLVAENGICIAPYKKHTPHNGLKNTVKIPEITEDHINIMAKGPKVRVIELIPGQIETRQTVLSALIRNGRVVSDTRRDILKLIVIERHHGTGRTGIGLVRGFGIKSGALASTVGHDSHNIISVGVDDCDIVVAVREIKRIHGGFVVANKEKVIASYPLPVAGLMSDQPMDVVVLKQAEVERSAESIGAVPDHPFGTLAFLALPVVPELKLTDRGLVDVRKFDFVDLFV